MRITRRPLTTFLEDKELHSYNEFMNDTVNALNDRAYGYMYIDENPVTINVAATGTLYKVTNMSEGDNQLGFTFADNELTCESPGIYLVIWSISMYGSQGRDIEGIVGIEDSKVEHTGNHADTPQANARTSLGGQGIISLDRGDTIQLFIHGHDTTGNITIEHANLTLLKIDY